MSFNGIQNISPDTMADLQRLKSLDLEFNRLKFFNESFLYGVEGKFSSMAAARAMCNGLQ